MSTARTAMAATAINPTRNWAHLTFFADGIIPRLALHKLRHIRIAGGFQFVAISNEYQLAGLHDHEFSPRGPHPPAVFGGFQNPTLGIVSEMIEPGPVLVPLRHHDGSGVLQ